MTYGLPGTPTVQHLRDYGFTSVSGIGGSTNIVGATTPILPDVSSLPGSTVNSQYVIWGAICGTTADAGTDAVFAGYLINTQDAHTAYADAASADDAVILSFATTKQGPFFFSTDHPIAVPKGSGVSLDANGITSNNVVYLYYSIKN